MSISIKKYAEITSGVGGTDQVAQRELILRLYTTSPLLPTNSEGVFTTAGAVGTYFGVTSEEYQRAVRYFGWISKSITAPQKISFGRWADVDTAPQIFGARRAQSLSAWQNISDGSLRLTIGGTQADLTGLNFSGVTSLADVASTIQTAIRAKAGAVFAGAIVSYDAIGQRFTFTGGATGPNTLAVGSTGTGTNLQTQLGWGLGAAVSDGVAAQSPVALLETSVENSNNFGSFAFIPELTLDQHVANASWNAARNVDFMYLVGFPADQAEDFNAALIGIPGVAMTLVADPNVDFDEQIPGTIMAATDYKRRNGVQNYMFQQFGITPKVSTTALSDTLDALRVNYYGRTQTAGQFIDFYQRGVLTGGATAPVDMNTYANEMWLKDRAATAFLNLLLILPRLPANEEGESQALATLQQPIDDALFNGTISVGKDLTTAQKLYVGQQSGDPEAWRQVQNLGYWVTVTVDSDVTSDGRTEYKIVYLLIYSKDDAIRKVEGTHILV